MKQLHAFTFLLLLIGGLNWLLYGLFNWEIGMLLGGMNSMLSRAVYILVGLSAIYELTIHKDSCNECSDPMPSPKPSMPKKIATKAKKKKK